MLDLSFKEDRFKNMTDEEMVGMSSTDSTAVSVLISRYAKLIWVKANAMANSVVDADDLAQEGLLGFVNAVSKFNPERNVKFATFAEICVSNKMKTLLNKNQDTATPVDDLNLNEDSVLPDTPESILVQKEHINELYDEIISLLSEREWKIFSLFLKGYSYKKIAAELNISEKSVDNAIQRIRRKLKSAWNVDRFM